MTRLWHYTCTHRASMIARDSHTIRPHQQVQFGNLAPAMIWLSDLRPPVRDALGLTMNYISCDRMAVEYEIADTAECQWWPVFRRRVLREHPGDAGLRAGIAGIEAAPGALPAHWWVSPVPLKAVA